jgi:hypothetical protein
VGRKATLCLALLVAGVALLLTQVVPSSKLTQNEYFNIVVEGAQQWCKCLLEEVVLAFDFG